MSPFHNHPLTRSTAQYNGGASTKPMATLSPTSPFCSSSIACESLSIRKASKNDLPLCFCIASSHARRPFRRARSSGDSPVFVHMDVSQPFWSRMAATSDALSASRGLPKPLPPLPLLPNDLSPPLPKFASPFLPKPLDLPLLSKKLSPSLQKSLDLPLLPKD